MAYKFPIFVDFDGTLFDTASLKEEIVKAFLLSGYEIEDIRSTYIAECLDYKYSPEGQYKKLLEIKHSNEKLVGVRLNNLYTGIKRHVYSDSQSFLKNLDKSKYEVNILTLGDLDFQTKKLTSSGLIELVDNVYVCAEQKWDYMQNLVKPHDYFVMIDDRADTLENVKSRYPKSLCIQVVRQDLDIDDAAKFYKEVWQGIRVHDMGQALRYL